MTIDRKVTLRTMLRWAHAEVRLAAASGMAAALLSACALGTPDARTPEEVVAQTSGRSMAATDTVTPGSGFGLDGLAYTLLPLTQKCHLQRGQLLTGRKRDVVFRDRRRERGPTSLALTEIVVCSQGSVVLWGANVELVDPEFLVAQSVGDGINYYAKVRTTFVPAAVVAANREAAERSRLTADAARNASAQARQGQLAECRRRRDESSKVLQANPQVGMRADLGLIVEVKPPLALIQYDPNVQALRGRRQEWIPVSALRAVEDCPA